MLCEVKWPCTQVGWLVTCIGNSCPVYMCVSMLKANLHLLLAGLEHACYMYGCWWYLNAGMSTSMLSLPCKRLHAYIEWLGRHTHQMHAVLAMHGPGMYLCMLRCTPILHTLPYLSKLHFESKMSGWTHSKHLLMHS